MADKPAFAEAMAGKKYMLANGLWFYPDAQEPRIKRLSKVLNKTQTSKTLTYNPRFIYQKTGPEHNKSRIPAQY